MNLMTETNSRISPAPKPTNTPVETISYATGKSLLGQVLVALSVKGVCAILIGDSEEEIERDLAARFLNAELVPSEAIVRGDLATVIRFVDKPAEGLHLSLDMRGTPFQRLVWEKIRAIPVGRTITYIELAYWVGPLTSARAVAGACAANPIALAVPCHRVVCSNGDLAGYRWGIERKRELIRKEAAA
jgi:O-6-methylguanine DNA methyltransferase